ncbi:hypothetical protein GCM10010269_72970 [Streptomyces humidus]|uniref:Uncharacterized protein n=1 Tax=Streptomyces humidus TaxID=52259 RepID=A0A918G903_9ACTN|nr:hypothetical protein [Streptomyces humidus]GGS23567.1 hypothetical protein GCM10010269_72970 [Streptomyces humidus]
MRELLLPIGLAGALLCLAGHLPGPVRHWGPASLALGGMALMAADESLPGACAVLAACLWCLLRAGIDGDGWNEAIDTAAMALLMALMTTGAAAVGGAHAHTAAGAAAGPAVLTLVVWVTARAGGFMFGQLSGVPRGTACAPPARRARVCRESGAVVMIVSMAAVFV